MKTKRQELIKIEMEANGYKNTNALLVLVSEAVDEYINGAASDQQQTQWRIGDQNESQRDVPEQAEKRKRANAKLRPTVSVD